MIRWATWMFFGPSSRAIACATARNPNLLMPPASVAASYWQLYQQPRSAWTFELEIRPFGEKW